MSTLYSDVDISTSYYMLQVYLVGWLVGQWMVGSGCAWLGMYWGKGVEGYGGGVI